MTCKFCHKPLGVQGNGAFICPNCRNINNINVPVHITLASQHSSGPTNPPSYSSESNKTSKLEAKFVSIAVLIILATSLLMAGFIYETAKAKHQLNLAKNNISQGKYIEADSLLATADKFYLIGNTKTDVKRTRSQNKVWLTYAGYLSDAKKLVAAGKYDAATSELNLISKSYPGYPQVSETYKEISLKVEASRKIVALPPSPAAAPQAVSVAPKKLQSTPASNTEAAFTTSIQIKGGPACEASTLEALKLLSQKAPAHYSTIVQYIGIIECVSSGSGVYAYETPTRYAVGDATRNAGTIWYAGTIAHDAGHSKLYHDYLLAHPGGSVPNDVWIGDGPERSCLEAQYDALVKMGASQYQLDYVKNVINTQYYNVPFDQRWW